MVEVRHRKTGGVLLRVDAASLEGVRLGAWDLRTDSFQPARLAGADLAGACMKGMGLIEAATLDGPPASTPKSTAPTSSHDPPC
jgi:hypothetical protein